MIGLLCAALLVLLHCQLHFFFTLHWVGVSVFLDVWSLALPPVVVLFRSKHFVSVRMNSKKRVFTILWVLLFLLHAV